MLPARLSAGPRLGQVAHLLAVTFDRAGRAWQEGFEGQMTEHNIELAVVTAEDRQLRILSAAEIK